MYPGIQLGLPCTLPPPPPPHLVPSLLLLYDELLLRYENFCMYTPILLSRVIGCHGNHEISYYQNALIFSETAGPTEAKFMWHHHGIGDKMEQLFK